MFFSFQQHAIERDLAPGPVRTVNLQETSGRRCGPLPPRAWIPRCPSRSGRGDRGMGEAFFAARVATVALGVLGLLGAMLAVTGIFGMASYVVSKRLRDLGIRVALGAGRQEILRRLSGPCLPPAGNRLGGRCCARSAGIARPRPHRLSSHSERSAGAGRSGRHHALAGYAGCADSRPARPGRRPHHAAARGMICGCMWKFKTAILPNRRR